MTITITDVAVHGAEAGHLYDDEQLAVSALVSNDGVDEVPQVTVTISFGLEQLEETIDVAAGQATWVTGTAGPLSAGGYDLEAGGHYEDRTAMVSQQLEPFGASVVIDHRTVPLPEATIESVHLQPHTNVDHPLATAWSTEAVRINVLVRNTGQVAVRGDVVVTVGGQRLDGTVEAAPAEAAWCALDAAPLVAGSHEVAVWLSTDTGEQSVALDHRATTLTVVEAPTDDGGGAGEWVVANAQFRVTDFRGESMRGHRLLVRFVGMDGTQAFGGETLEATAMQNGLQTCARVHVPREGTAQLYVVSESGGLLLEGQSGYQLVGTDRNMSFDVVQQHDDVTLSARSAEEVSRMVGAETSAGINIEILEVGGKVATEETRSRSYERAVEWKVRVAMSRLQVTPTDPAGGPSD